MNPPDFAATGAMPENQNIETSGRRCWGLLIALQLLVGLALFHEFFSGARVFSYADIGSDSHALFTPQLMHLADYVRREGWPMWSFAFGLGAPFLYPADPFSWLSVVAGAEPVLALRIWVYALKLLLGGWAFHAFLRRLPVAPGAAVFGALAYTFCGYAVINGQWDPMASEVAVYPLLLWAFVHRLQGGSRWVLPVVVGLLIASSGFVVSLFVFAFFCFVLAVLVAESPAAHARRWLTSVGPPFVLGLLLAAPVLLPNLLLLLDSPRVAGGAAQLAARLGELLSLNDGRMVLSEIAGLFHKDLLGRGNDYVGWMNYFEGPGFYVGTLALLLIPQLGFAPGRGRRLLLVGGGFVLLYFLLPAIRQLAFAFAVPYFRVSSLWLGMLLLGLAVFGLDRVLRRGLDRRGLAVAALLVLATPLALHLALPAPGGRAHLAALLGFATAGVLLLGLFAAGRLNTSRLTLLLLLLVAGEIVVVARPSYHRTPGVVVRGALPYADLSQQLIGEIQARDPAFYRIEKTFESISEADALAQGYFGVRSYGFHGSSVVRLFTGLGLVAERRDGINASNWLPGFGQRFPLYSLVGVKYVLSRAEENWPGFTPLGGAGELRVYRNELALPLGVLHDRQIPEAEFAASRGIVRDVAMLHGVVSEVPLPGLPVLPLAALATEAGADWAQRYLDAAGRRQRKAMRLDEFSPNRLRGQVTATADAVLVWSIPFSAGWTARLDGSPVPTFRANLGMTAIRVAPGSHRVELSYFPPGLIPGLAAALAALLLLLAPALIRRRASAGRLP